MKHDIPKLKVSEIIKLCGEIDDRRRKSMIDDLNAMDVDHDAKLAALADHDRYRNQPIVLFRYATSVEGAYDIVQRALRQMENPPALDDLGLDPSDSLLVLACSLVGMDLKAMVGKKDSRPDPQESSLSLSAATG